MPTVPRLQNRVSTEALPAPQADTTAAPEAFGGGRAADRTYAAAQGVLEDQMVRQDAQAKAEEKLFLEQKRKADEIVVQDFDLATAQAQQDIDTKIKSLRGRDAMRAPDVADQEWKKASENLRKNLYNDDQRLAAHRIENARKEMLYKTAQDHAFVESEKYDDSNTSAYLETVRNDAYLNAMDDERIGLSIFQQRAALEKYGTRKGLTGSDALKGMIAEAVSDTHMGVIEKRVGNGDIPSARAYYKAHEKELIGKESLKFPEYFDALEKRQKAEADNAKKNQYDATLRKNMIDAFSGKLTLTELQRQFRADETDVSDYKSMAHIVADPDFLFMRPDKLTDPATFNEIRQAQISGSKSQGEILRMITTAMADGKIANNAIQGKDGEYLIKLTKEQVPQTPTDSQTEAQANYVRDFAGRYLADQDNFFDQFIPEGEKDKAKRDAEVEGVVSDFFRRVDKEQAQGERIDEIAKEVIGEKVKKQFPGVNRMEDIPHVVIDAKGKVHRVLNPEQKSKLKANYRVVPHQLEAPPEKKKKEK